MECGFTAKCSCNTGVMAHYRKPGWTQHILNSVVAGMTRFGVSVWGSRVLRVKGRHSGEWRSTPVNLLSYESNRYLVAPRGETQWVRNLRAAGEGELGLGRRIDRFRAVELSEAEKVPILRAYLKRWKLEVGIFFDGTSASSSDEELRRIGPMHPVFRVEIER
jgi:deazaflavin-dependent oxidoreductase (nitroreductase family)